MVQKKVDRKFNLYEFQNEFKISDIANETKQEGKYWAKISTILDVVCLIEAHYNNDELVDMSETEITEDKINSSREVLTAVMNLMLCKAKENLEKRKTDLDERLKQTKLPLDN